MKTIGIFSKLGMPGGSENRVTQLANAFSRRMPTYIFAEKEFSSKLKPQLDGGVILRENTVKTPRYIYELQGLDSLLVVNSDSYSFCKASYWDGTQGKHHKSTIDLSQIPCITFLFNYVVSPAQWLTELHEINPNIKILCTSNWFIKNIESEDKFKEVRELKIPMDTMFSPVSSAYALPKTPSAKIRINRHSMGFAYKHDQDNIEIVKHLCDKYGDKISFKWMGVPSAVRDVNGDDKDEKVSYKDELLKNKQVTVLPEYALPVPQFLQETDILFFYISRFRKEPWPRTIAEGMMASCCCVTNNNYGMAEQIKHGETGYLFNDAKQAIEQLSFLIEHPDIIRQVGMEANNSARNTFLDDVIIDKTLDFMK